MPNPIGVVAGSARDRLEALERIVELRPDVLTLDAEMPRMDGLAALQRIMAEHPTSVMLSSRTQQGARTTIQALMRGAIDFVAKPDGANDMRAVMTELIEKIKIAAETRPSAWRARAPSTHRPRGITPRAFKRGDPLVIIGASTGGPRVLEQVFADLPASIPAALVVVQHMPAGFTRSLAQRLDETYPVTAHEAADGVLFVGGTEVLSQPQSLGFEMIGNSFYRSLRTSW